jgi:hypothetical protein
VQVDFLHRDALPAGELPVGLGVLVLEDDGTLVPASYGVPRRFAVCNTTTERVGEAWPAFLAERWPAFLDFGRGILQRFLESDRAVLNWHEALVTAEPAGAEPVAPRTSA